MQRSPLPLATWFAAIRTVIFHPTISTSQLAATLGVKRTQTVRTMVKKIRAAISADNATELLAGLG